jgi:uncharacterized repeat protein (TIGR02543 family)
MKKLKSILLLMLIGVLMLTMWACKDDIVDSEGVDEATTYDYTISFASNGGSALDSIIINSALITETTITLPADPTRDNYTFAGWYFDNESFSDKVENIASVVSRFSTDNRLITLYAMWTAVVDTTGTEGDTQTYTESISCLNTEIESAYASIYPCPEVPSEEDVTRLAELEILLSLDSEYLDANWYSAKSYLGEYEVYTLYQSYVDVSDYIADNSDADDIEEKTVERDNLSSQIEMEGYTEEEKLSYIRSSIECGYSTYIGVEQETIDLYTEYETKAQIKLDYDEYVEEKASFIDFATEYLSSITDADIRQAKIVALANYMSEFDYDTIKVIVEDEEDTDISSSSAFSMIFDGIEAAEFTNDDIGLLLYKLIIKIVDEQNIESDEDIAEYNDMIALEQEKEEADNALIAEYQENIESIENAQVQLTLFRNTLTIEFVKDLAALGMDFFNVAEDNGLMGIIETTYDVDGQDVPTLAEIATMVSAMKVTCDEFIAQYDVDSMNSLYTSLTSIITILKESDGSIGTIAEVISVLVPDSNMINDVQIFSNLLGLATEENLDIFLDVNVVDGYNEISYSPDGSLLMDNYAILEAKLITAIVGDEFDAEAMSNAYTGIINLIIENKDEISEIFGFDSDGLDSMILYGIDNGLDYLTNLLDERTLNFTEEEYNTLQSLAALDFLTEENISITDEMYDVVLFYNISNKQSELFEILSYFNADVETDNYVALGVAVILEMSNIDTEKVTAFRTYLDEYEESDEIDISYVLESINDTFYLIGNGLFESGFTVNEIDNILTNLLPCAISYAKEMAPEFGVTSDTIISALETLSTNETDIDALSYLIANLIEVLVDTNESVEGIVVDESIANSEELQKAVIYKAALETIKDLYVGENAEGDIESLGNALELVANIIGECDSIEMLQSLDCIVYANQTVSDMVIELISIYGFENTIYKIEAIIDEWAASAEYENEEYVEADDSYVNNDNYYIYISRCFITLFGETPSTEFASVILIAGDVTEENEIATIVDDFLNIYADMQVVAAVDYNDVEDDPSEGFTTSRLAIEEFLNGSSDDNSEDDSEEGVEFE